MNETYWPEGGSNLRLVALKRHICNKALPVKRVAVVVVVNHCFTSLFGTKGLLSDIIIRQKRCSQLMR